MSIPEKKTETVEDIAYKNAIKSLISSNYELPKYTYRLTGRLVDELLKIKEITHDTDDKKGSELSELQLAYVDFIKWAFNFDKKATRYKLISAKINTFLVFLLIIGGLTFSGFQLWQAIKLNNLNSLNTNMQIETAGAVSINSSVVGGVILVISIAFFYLYLRFAYEKPVINIYKHDISPPDVGK